jgi:hypothetical protein
VSLKQFRHLVLQREARVSENDHAFGGENDLNLTFGGSGCSERNTRITFASRALILFLFERKRKIEQKKKKTVDFCFAPEKSILEFKVYSTKTTSLQCVANAFLHHRRI